MKLKNIMLIVSMLLTTLTVYAQKGDDLLQNKKGGITLQYEQIKMEKKDSTFHPGAPQVASRAEIPGDGDLPIDGDPIDPRDPIDLPCLIDPRTGECIDIIDPPGGGGSSSSATAGRTRDNFDVSLSGSAIYSIPIALPPGIRTIKPNIALSYNSQAGNGLVGWGWNISGISTISRIPATKFHDGQSDGVDFDSKDRYALDGQRLVLKSGSYGASNSVYQTENYSNVKIRAIGTSPYGSAYGPSYFIVHYPDGTKAFYGNASNSRSRLEWSLYKTEDPQGNYVQYSYLQNNGLSRINTIKYNM